ncbi:hypothetical protein G4B88_030398 [Cannabis sativa]|uniref:Uncharacterized protein n=1 Tax=Cannabis sativa TaxID=3483 RepID=A0A7J6FPL7_CANSA|nr:hypothetical protein G4B88_030398 [Cannabis sativa]
MEIDSMILGNKDDTIPAGDNCYDSNAKERGSGKAGGNTDSNKVEDIVNLSEKDMTIMLENKKRRMDMATLSVELGELNVQRTNDSPTIVDVPQSSEMVANVDDSRDDEDEEIAEDLEDDLLIDHLEDEIEEAPATNLHFISDDDWREVALHVPGHHPSWANVPEQYEHLILTKLQHYYQLDSHPKLVAILIAEMAEKYKTRKNIRLQHFREYYKNPEDFENAVKNPPNELNEDQWRLICELFTTSDFIQRSKQNSINRQKMKFSSTTGSVTRAEILRQKQGKGYIETWKECHTKKDTNTFINEAAKNKYEEMLTTQNSAPESSQVSELEILRKTLGERRGHQRGVGRKLKGQSSGRCSQPATADQPDLRETVVELQKQIQTLTQQMSRERREPMDVEMNDAAPTQPIRPQPSRSQMGFNPMGFQQPHQTPTSFQQLLQQPLVPSPGMLSPEQFQSQMYQSYLQFMFQSPNNSQKLFNNDIVVIDNNINNDNAVVNALRT